MLDKKLFNINNFKHEYNTDSYISIKYKCKNANAINA